jgi:hypothetical protein
MKRRAGDPIKTRAQALSAHASVHFKKGYSVEERKKLHAQAVAAMNRFGLKHHGH